jgi:alpha-D-ribose 1-methylphosphonate 5-triphosphate synthase subunit PhnG
VTTALPRSQWVRVLSALPREEICQAARRLTSSYRVTPKILPQAGLGLLQMKDGAFEQAYYLGEFPLARAHIELSDAAGHHFQGAAQIMADDADWAEALALCDAVLAHRLEGWVELEALLNSGLEKLTESERRRHAMLAGTRVNFALMGEADGIDED